MTETMKKHEEVNWRRCQIKWQHTVGVAKRRGASKEELDKMVELLPLMKKYRLYSDLELPEEDQKEVEG